MSKEIQNVMILHGYNESPPIITGDYEYILEIYTEDDGVGARKLSHKEIWIRNLNRWADLIACFKNKNKTAIPQIEENDKSEKTENDAENKQENPHGEVTV